MLNHKTDLEEWLRIIRAEYREFPGMHLTKAQVQRLWNLDSRTCTAAIHALVAERFLRRTHRNGYVRTDV
jgi:hypothetical protein